MHHPHPCHPPSGGLGCGLDQELDVGRALCLGKMLPQEHTTLSVVVGDSFPRTEASPSWGQWDAQWPNCPHRKQESSTVALDLPPPNCSPFLCHFCFCAWLGGRTREKSFKREKGGRGGEDPPCLSHLLSEEPASKGPTPNVAFVLHVETNVVTPIQDSWPRGDT